jgi:predicted GNAT family N-acyltransferase
MRTPPQPKFRPLSRGELDTLLDWAAKEGWNPGIDDAEAFWAADPEGFWGIETEEGLVGGASIVSYAGKAGFVGLFIVKPEWRGCGLGREFWRFFCERLVGRLQPDAPLSLDGVFAMQPFYAASGFVFTHRNLRMAGVGVAARPDSRLVELKTLPFQTVSDFDHAHFGARREAFLQHWITPPGGLGLGFVGKDGDRLEGMGVIRPCRSGFKIGPLFAAEPEVAESLYTALSSHAAGQPIFLDTPENNQAALALAARHGLKEAFGCARMVRGSIPSLPWNRIYGVTTFELG